MLTKVFVLASVQRSIPTQVESVRTHRKEDNEHSHAYLINPVCLVLDIDVSIDNSDLITLLLIGTQTVLEK